MGVVETSPVPTASVPPKGPRSARRTLMFALKLLISIGLIGLLLRRIDTDAMLRSFADIRWRWLLIGLALHQLQMVFSTIKWGLILRADGQRVRNLFLFKTNQIGGFLSLFLPTSFGGDVYRAWALNRIGVKTSKSAASVLFDRLSGLFALLSIGVAGAVMLLERRNAVLIVLFYAVAVVGFLVSTGDTVVGKLPEEGSRVLGFPFRILRSFNTYRHHPGTFTKTIALSLCFQFNVVLIVMCYSRSMGVTPEQISFLEMVAVLPIVFLSEVLPSINGIGVRDGAFVFFYSMVGSTAEQAMAVSLLVLMIRYALSLIGAAFWIRSMFGSSTSEAPPESVEVAGIARGR